MTIPANEMIHLQMTLPPGEELFNFPAEGVNEGYLFGCEVCPAGSNPVDLPPNTKSHKIHRMLHTVLLTTQLYLSEEKHLASFLKGEFLQYLPPGVTLQSSHKVLSIIYP